jgi:prevent-host-death family protein
MTRYVLRMRTMTVSEASRNFSALLDAVERGETVTITRGGRAVAEMRPARHRTGADLRAALEQIRPPDDQVAADIADALAVISGERDDPRAGA